MNQLAISIILASCAALDLIVVLKRDLMMLQQNSYRNERYIRWFNTSSETTSPWRMGACIALFLLLVNNLPELLANIISAGILFANFIAFIKRKYKKPLVFTKRAIRLYVVICILAFALPVVLGVTTHSFSLANKLVVLSIVISPFFIILSNLLLSPVEKYINGIYIRQAKQILKSNPNIVIIGITGSYGKTSTKHFLQHILRQKYETLMTPGSFNTLLGVVRTVRESLKPYTEVFIVEMGAKQKGDIKEICDFVHPHIGIVTSIGEQHLESFKTLDNILNTKMELADALPADGCAVINDSNAAVRKKQLSCSQVIYFGTDDDDYYITEVNYDGGITSLKIKDRHSWTLELKTPLVGQANLTNLLAAVIVAKKMNVSDVEIKYAAATMPQVEHRLQVRNAAGYIILDDAFNSNPKGAAMALEVLEKMTRNGGNKIIITPGMIELGDLQFEKNEHLGKEIGNAVDMAIIVGQYNREALLKGLEQSKIDRGKVFAVDTFAEAQKLMLFHVRHGDVVLLENDLPDTFK